MEFVRERVKSSIPLQIRALREQRNQMTQKQLGDAIGMAQTWISRLEDPEYGKMTVATLLRLAEAFDTDLEVKFRPFSRGLHDLSRQGPEYFIVPSFEQELPAMEAYVDRGATVEALPYSAMAAALGQQPIATQTGYSADFFETMRNAMMEELRRSSLVQQANPGIPKIPPIASAPSPGTYNANLIDGIHLARIIHEGTESGSLGGVCALRMVVAA